MDTKLEGTFEVAAGQDGTLVLLAPKFAKTLGVVLRGLCQGGALSPRLFFDEGHKAEGTEIVAINELARVLAGDQK